MAPAVMVSAGEPCQHSEWATPSRPRRRKTHFPPAEIVRGNDGRSWMRVIVVGTGEVGSSVAASLASEHEVVVVDVDGDRVEALTYDGRARDRG